ncbi:MAG: ribbon-helix-helix protein, CopG family [Caldilineaceae bacterium SB0670_bin_27]|uniref:Ribbon-helix-helix protein, CopG family n=1 Tax=Caldilineaceae bacterium SB0664_bin_27 TaxID=2605260 RepID=A0A6B0YUC6_9CHLR|nr:ribbon-helix-helix protein, CopG family [Caldilineaceae bacterium SB0664_bin_27]MYJ77524.1 ribbon-helix-helix protein, CopG family [Caldilineaceae bacterium SB0670_bin_27]
MTVRIEITLSSTLIEKVESLARELEMSRNELLSIAVQEFIERRETRRMMEALNEVHGDPPDEEELAILRQMLELHRKTLRDDPW